MQRGFLYLVAVMDWATRTVLSWRLSNTLDTAFCREALQEALARYGRPEIFNTDQGSQFVVQIDTLVFERAPARRHLASWLRYYNQERPHSSLGGDRTPMEAYTGRRAA